MNPYYPGHPPFPGPPAPADQARVPGIAGLCFAIILLISTAITSVLVFKLLAAGVLGVPALALSVASFQRPGNRFWAGLAFVIMMATPVVSALVEYVSVIAEIG